MSEAERPASPATPTPTGGRFPFQVGLLDLIVWVLGVGVAASVFREVRPTRWLALPIDVDLYLIMAAVLLEIFLGIGLLRQLVARGRRRPRARGDFASRAAVAWRLAVLVLLVAFAVEAAATLRDDRIADAWDGATVRAQLLPVSATLAMAGIVAGLSPGRLPRRRMAWLSVVWAGIAAVAIATAVAFLPHLVLLALEAVSNAMTRPEFPRRPRPGLHERISLAGLESIPVLASCLFLALWLSRELRRPAPRAGAETRGETRTGSRFLLAATLATASGTAWLLLVTLPLLHDQLAEGLWMVLRPRVALIVVLGLAGLSIGLAARSADRDQSGGPEADRGEDHPSRRSRIIWGVLEAAFALVLLDVIISRALTDFAFLDAFPLRWIGWAEAAFGWLWSIAPDPTKQVWRMAQAPEWLVVGVAQVWIAWRVLWMLIAPINLDATPIDASLADHRAFGRFAARWVALTVLMLASMPVLFVLGLTVLHFLYRLPGI